MGSGHRLHGDVIEARDLLEDVHARGVDFEEAPDGLFRLHRVGVSESRQPSRALVNLRVVFHRAATQGVEADFDPVVAVAEVGEVA